METYFSIRCQGSLNFAKGTLRFCWYHWHSSHSHLHCTDQEWKREMNSGSMRFLRDLSFLRILQLFISWTLLVVLLWTLLLWLVLLELLRRIKSSTFWCVRICVPELFLDDYVEGILEKRTPFRAGHLGLAKVWSLFCLLIFIGTSC